MGPQPLLLFAAASALVIFCLLGLYSAVIAHGKSDALDDGEALTRSVASALADQLTRATQTVELILAEATDFSLNNFSDIGANRLAGVPQIRALLATDAAGKVIQSSVPALMGAGVGDRAWFRDLRINGQALRIGNPEAGRYLGSPSRPIAQTRIWSIPMTRALQSPQGEFDGAAIALLNPDYFVAIARRYADAFGVTLRLYSFNGVLLARSDGAADDIGVLENKAWPFRIFLPRNETGSYRGTDMDGRDVLASFAVTRQGSFVIEVTRSVDDTLAGVRRLGRLLSFGIGAAALVSLWALWRMSRLAEKLRFMAHHDALTRLPNRALFHERLEHAAAGLRSTDKGFAVLFIDLDNFKNVNDDLGHPAGDLLLKLVAQRLEGCVRRDDFICRLGGDEFAILQYSSAYDFQAATQARRVIDTLSQPYDLEGQQAVVSASIGIAMALPPAANADQLLKNADMALYRAKWEGRATYRFFNAEMNLDFHARLKLETELREALKRREFEVFYQPFFDLAHNRVAGFEALLRWRRPNQGLISPATFIPIAEDLGIIIEIGDWVLEQACRDAAAWPSDLKVAVNLSPVQFREGNDLVASVERAIACSGLAPERLELEVTESILLQGSEKVVATLFRLRAMGLGTALDDFGTGYSSLSYLRSFPFDKLKIDQSFVREMESRPDCFAIVCSVISLAGKLGISTTAEGVETPEQLEQLRRAGCNEAQGYFFDQPKPVQEIQRWFLHPGIPSLDSA